VIRNKGTGTLTIALGAAVHAYGQRRDVVSSGASIASAAWRRSTVGRPTTSRSSGRK
jgi:hypothetical protein